MRSEYTSTVRVNGFQTLPLPPASGRTLRYPRTMKRILTVFAVAAALSGCNQYRLFQFTGFEQETFSAKADILFVVDNSDSMQEEATSLATSFAGFVGQLSEETDAFPTETLADAVQFYAASTAAEGGFVNYQLGVTTTDVDAGPGELYGSGLISRFEDDPSRAFAKNVLCEATCFNEAPPGGNVTCGDPLGNNVTSTWLDCECDGAWEANCGGAQEEPIEAVFMAMCRSVPNPPFECFNEEFSDFRPADVMSNGEFLRDNSTFIPVIVTDEGDDSRRVEGNEPIPTVYRNLFGQFDRRMVWTVIGPQRNEGGGFPCPTGASDWGTLRLNHFVESTSGLFIPITDQGNGCAARDFDDSLAQLSDLLNNLNRSFRLGTLPVDGTIVVFTSDGGTVPEAEFLGFSDAGVPIYDTGWSYDLGTNTVLLHGDAVPSFDEAVTVYYQPQDGNPRELPF